MEHKGTIWAIIFILIIVFVLLNTLSIQQATTPLDIEAFTPIGYQANMNLREIDLRPTNQPTGLLYQHFTFDTTDDNVTIHLSVKNNWMKIEGVAPTTIKFYRDDNGWWTPVTLRQATTYNDATTYTAQVTSGTYIIMGEQGSAPKGKGMPNIQVQIGILIITIIILPFIAYHNSQFRGRHKHKESPNLLQLERYVKDSLLAGHDEQAIKERLTSAGWDEQHIDQALRQSRFF